MTHDVFICYANEDKIIADDICTTLEANRIRCWIAPRDVLPGKDWGEAISDGINESHLMVLVFSSKSNSSEYVKDEIGLAVSGEKQIIPFRIEDIVPSGSLALHLARRHWLDALTPPLEKHLKRLLETVQLLLPSEAEDRQQVVGASVPEVPQPSKEAEKKFPRPERFSPIKTPPTRRKPRPKLKKILVSALVVIAVAGVGIVAWRNISKLKVPELSPLPSPRKVEDYFESGYKFWENKNYSSAIVQFEKILIKEPENFEATISLATILKEQGKIDEAISEYEKAIAFNDLEPLPYKHLGELHERKQELEKAVIYYKQYLERAPESAEFDAVNQKIKDLEAQYPLEEEPKEEPEEEPKEEPVIEPDKEEIERIDITQELDSGIEAFKQRDYDRCIALMEEVLRMEPENTSAQYYLAIAKMKKREELKEQGIRANLKAAQEAFERRDYKECVKQSKRVLELDSKNTEAREYLDKANMKLAPEQIGLIVHQYVQSINNKNLLTFYKNKCSPQLYESINRDAELILNLYENLDSRASDINIRFEGVNQAEVTFFHLMTGVSKADGTRQVLFDGILNWNMEKQVENWKIVEISSRAHRE